MRLGLFFILLGSLLLNNAASAQTADQHASLQERIIRVSEAMKPLVVHIEAIVKVNDQRNHVEGSGVIASRDGLVLTNHHVVDKAQKVEVIIPGHKQEYPAEILGTDKQTDIAVLRIQIDEPLPAAEFGSSKDLRVGEWVLAIGNPYGLEGTVSFGIVSAKGRNLEVRDLLNDFIQTDAMIDRGSSGGPLIDLEGRVVGINSRGQGRGIGFTIPIETALDVMAQIERGGVARGWMGVTVQPLDRDLAAYFSIDETAGVVINSVSPKSPAAKAGLKVGDILTHFNEEAIEAEHDEDLGDFQRMVASHEPGNEATLRFVRNGKNKRTNLRIGTQPKVEPAEEESDAGFHVQEITERLFRVHRLDTRNGAYVSFVARGSPAAEAGLRPGDVIASIDDQKIRNLEDFRSHGELLNGQARYLLRVRRGDETKFLLIKPGSKEKGKATLEALSD